jgi:serine-type D-Ala-D-Ala carboxypeptidase (penicillin-binding protein 5/6)
MMRRCIPFLCLIFSFGMAGPGLAAPAAKPKKKPAATVPVAKPKPAPAEVLSLDPSGKAPQIRLGSAILLDARTGEVLLDVNGDKVRPVASTQKLLTALLVAESGNLDQNVRVETPDTWTEPSMLYIKPGEVYERSRLLKVLLVKSMNDVARCLARDNAGSIEGFAARMNARAEQLGMTHSHFINPNGLPMPGQYSTARDMSKVAMAAYRNRTIRSLVCLKEVTWEFNDGRVKTFPSTNRVLKSFEFCNGMKTGYTEAAGHCLISSASKNGRDVISVVLGGSRDSIWIDSYRLLAWGLTQ